MSVSEAKRPHLRALALGELLDVAFRICATHWRTLLKAVLVVIVPVQIISTIVTADYTLSSFDVGSNTEQTTREAIDELNANIDGLLVSGLLQILALVFATAACLRAIVSAYLGELPDWRGSLAYALRHAGPLLALTALYVGGVAIGAIAMLLPGIWLYIAWVFALPALLVEGLRGPAALRRSYILVRGRWWRTFGVIALGFILAIVISTLARGVFLLGLLVADDDAIVLALSTLAGIIGLAVSAPFQAALLTVLYFDTRVRTENLELDQLAGEIGVDAPSADGAAPPAAAIGEPVASGAAGSPLWPSPPAPAGQDDGARSRARPRPDAPPPPPGWRSAPHPPAPPHADDGGSAERAGG
ncbi:MAG: hypothetical protein QOI64_586 [Solirubrobacteraceae bacterium]|nr:hypothetical protein [Solirubrobacteraceae bacterium]